MTPEQIAKLPQLNPTVQELLARLERHREGGRRPTSMAMSPETWERIKAEAAAAGVQTRDGGEDWYWFQDTKVRLFEGCLGIGIAYTQT